MALLGGLLFVWPSALPAASPDAARDAAVVQTLLRLPQFDVNAKPKWRAAVLRHLETLRGTPKYVELIERLKLRGVRDQLIELATEADDENVAVKAATLVIRRHGLNPFRGLIENPEGEPDQANRIVEVLARVESPAVNGWLQQLVTAPQTPRPIRLTAASGVARSLRGQEFLLQLAKDGTLPADAQFTVANALLSSPDAAIREQAREHLSLPAGVDSEPLPPVAELVKLSADAKRGARLFRTTGTCSKCHRVGDEGKEVGPDLSEIGSKLTPEALFVSILDPSAGISHNYETFTAILETGSIVSGILVSRTPEAVTIRTAEALDRTFALEEVEELVKSQVSLMPNDLQRLMTAQELADIVAYLRTLKRKSS